MGFLSQSHQKTVQGNHIIQSNIDALNNEESVLKSQIITIDITLEGLPKTHVTRRIRDRKMAGRKKIKTCEGWLKGTVPTPPRALADVQAWVEKKYVKKPDRLY